MKHIMVWGVVGLALVIGSSIAADKDNESPRAASRTAGRAARPVDVASKMVEIEVLIVETTSRDDQKDDRIQFADLAEGNRAESLVRELEKQGKLDVLNRIRLTTLDQQPAHVHVGERRPVVTSKRYTSRAGAVSTAAEYQNVGTILQVTPRVAGDGVVMDLEIEKSRLDYAPPAPDGQNDDNTLLPPRITVATCQTTITVASGKTVIAGGMQTQSDQEGSMFLVLVKARQSTR